MPSQVPFWVAVLLAAGAMQLGLILGVVFMAAIVAGTRRPPEQP